MGKWIVIIILIVAVGTAVVYLVMKMISFDKMYKEYSYLINPQILEKKSAKMLTVAVYGDPALNLGPAFSALYNTFFKLKKYGNTLPASAPKVRWPMTLSEDTPKEEWKGIVAVPVSEDVSSLPDNKTGMEIVLTEWEYGTVAEILHIGPYSDEMTTIEKLSKFISNNGYRVIGEHEEEYIRSYEMIPFLNNPDKYMTIIRFRIEKIK